MGVMEKMRNSTTSILWILIVSFGLLWVLADTQVFDALGAGPRSLGQVNGEPISFEEYNNRVSSYIDQFNRQSGETMTPEIRAGYEEQAWEDLVAAKLLQQKMEELGITVTDNELVDMITGENPDPFIRQQFQDEEGNIDRIALRAAIEAPENTEIWMLIENQLRESRRQQKLTNYIMSGLKVSDEAVKREFIRNNTFADVEFIRFPYADIRNSEIELSEDELRSYYRNNRERYSRDKSWRFRYVSWEITPTSEDTTKIFEEVRALKDQFAQADDDSMFVTQYESIVPFRNAYVAKDEIREEFSPVLELDEGEVSDVVEVNGNPYLFKNIDEQNGEIKFAVLALEVVADPVATIDKMAREADDFSFFASEEGFETEAERAEKTIRDAFATEGNPFIPGIGQSRQLLRTLESLGKNGISDPIELADRFVVIQLVETIPDGVRPFEEVRSQVENRVRIEKRKELVMQQVNDYLSTANSLEELAEASGKEIMAAENLRMSASVLTGGGREPKVIGTIFGIAINTLSDPVEGENAVFVVRKNNETEADLSQLNQTQQDAIRRSLEQQRFMAFNQIWLEELKETADIVDYRDRVLYGNTPGHRR